MPTLSRWYGLGILILLGVFRFIGNNSFSSYTPLIIFSGVYLIILIAGIAQFRSQTPLSKAFIILGLVFTVWFLLFTYFGLFGFIAEIFFLPS